MKRTTRALLRASRIHKIHTPGHRKWSALNLKRGRQTLGPREHRKRMVQYYKKHGSAP